MDYGERMLKMDTFSFIRPSAEHVYVCVCVCAVVVLLHFLGANESIFGKF